MSGSSALASARRRRAGNQDDTNKQINKPKQNQEEIQETTIRLQKTTIDYNRLLNYSSLETRLQENTRNYFYIEFASALFNYEFECCCWDLLIF